MIMSKKNSLLKHSDMSKCLRVLMKDFIPDVDARAISSILEHAIYMSGVDWGIGTRVKSTTQKGKGKGRFSSLLSSVRLSVRPHEKSVRDGGSKDHALSGRRLPPSESVSDWCSAEIAVQWNMGRRLLTVADSLSDIAGSSPETHIHFARLKEMALLLLGVQPRYSQQLIKTVTHTQKVASSLTLSPPCVSSTLSRTLCPSDQPPATPSPPINTQHDTPRRGLVSPMGGAGEYDPSDSEAVDVDTSTILATILHICRQQRVVRQAREEARALQARVTALEAHEQGVAAGGEAGGDRETEVFDC
ncbi:hypothetical protein KIPB_000631 [Kipferlia bialata]|uniref:Uncharacterized protein n=1 Tax=Kipferlia bialata TaxID=797122 RepID=A0A9K3CMN2_9EUKA|nr:hypothetical protein KIPB_000631 [Kipferlia bialata]|eukprot:g631.t1